MKIYLWKYVTNISNQAAIRAIKMRKTLPNSILLNFHPTKIRAYTVYSTVIVQPQELKHYKVVLYQRYRRLGKNGSVSANVLSVAHSLYYIVYIIW